MPALTQPRSPALRANAPPWIRGPQSPLLGPGPPPGAARLWLVGAWGPPLTSPTLRFWLVKTLRSPALPASRQWRLTTWVRECPAGPEAPVLGVYGEDERSPWHQIFYTQDGLRPLENRRQGTGNCASLRMWTHAGAGGDSRRLRVPRSLGNGGIRHVGASLVKGGNRGVDSRTFSNQGLEPWAVAGLECFQALPYLGAICFASLSSGRYRASSALTPPLVRFLPVGQQPVSP